MNSAILKNLIIAIFIVGIMLILKFYLKTSDPVILFLVIWIVAALLIRTLIVGYLNPPYWLYRTKYSFIGLIFGILTAIMLFGTEAIENEIFIANELLRYILFGAVLGAVLNGPVFNHSTRLNRRKGTFLLEKQLVKDYAQIITEEGQRINGKLFLTDKSLLFLDGRNEEKIVVQDIAEVETQISKMKYCQIPNGFKIENGKFRFKVQFPNYWIKRIRKRQELLASPV